MHFWGVAILNWAIWPPCTQNPHVSSTLILHTFPNIHYYHIFFHFIYFLKYFLIYFLHHLDVVTMESIYLLSYFTKQYRKKDFLSITIAACSKHSITDSNWPSTSSITCIIINVLILVSSHFTWWYTCQQIQFVSFQMSYICSSSSSWHRYR